MIRTSLLVLLFALSPLSQGATASRESMATVTATRKGDAAVIHVAPPAGTHLNYSGPWKLQVGEKTVGIDGFDKSTASFTLKQPDSGDFKLAYFLCSDDNVWCKRIETKGEIK